MKKLNRPRMYYQPANGAVTVFPRTQGDRIRIFYPDGTVEWASCYPVPNDSRSWTDYTFETPPCYGGKFETMLAAIQAADEYDLRMGYPRMEFLGEL